MLNAPVGRRAVGAPRRRREKIPCFSFSRCPRSENFLRPRPTGAGHSRLRRAPTAPVSAFPDNYSTLARPTCDRSSFNAKAHGPGPHPPGRAHQPAGGPVSNWVPHKSLCCTYDSLLHIGSCVGLSVTARWDLCGWMDTYNFGR